MSWFLDLKARYAPLMTPRAFSDLLNEVEIKLFNEHPEYLKIARSKEEDIAIENAQNIKVEEALRKAIQ